MYEIVIKYPGQKGMLGKLVPGTYRVGSGTDCHIQLQNDPGIASSHALFVVGEEGLKIVVLDSSKPVGADGAALEANVETAVFLGALFRL